SLELMDAEEPPAEFPGPEAWDTHRPPELAGAEDPPSPPGPPTLDEILDEGAASEPRPMGRLDTPPSAPPRRREAAPRARRVDEKKKGRSGRGSVILLVLLVGVLAVLVAGWLGLVEIPGITRSTSAGVEEAGAAVPGQDGPGEGEAEAAPETPSEATPGGAGSGVESPAATYVLALGSYSSHDSARARARVLADAIPDVPFLVAPVEVEGTAFYRLLAGSAPDTAAIRAVQAELSGAAPGARDWIMRRAGLGFLLGSPATLALAERQVDALAALGIPAHILRYDDGAGVTEYRVYAGAYADPGEARYMARLLAENDIQNATLTERKGVRP
ncbi:MAG TPA: SPOR domain-containing protein, partial [Longimicrobiales bacterium]|nr:SPOR domain-containing protein [Longimicrobiales bacterium]